MATLNLKVDFQRLTLDDLVAIEEGDQSARFVRSILARFAVDPATGEFYPEDQGVKVAGKLSVDDAKAAVISFSAKVQEIKDQKVPLAKDAN